MQWILIMFVSFGTGATASVKVGFNTPDACLNAGDQMKQAFQREHEPEKIQVVWGCHPAG